MGTFHSDMGPLHGMTIVVDTKGPLVYVGRCHEMDEQRIVLHGADMHRDGEGGRSKADYLARAAEIGVWSRHERIEVSRSEVASIRRL